MQSDSLRPDDENTQKRQKGPPSPESPVIFYRQMGVWSLYQFGVLPEYQGRGIASQLHAAAVEHACTNGGTTMALDTADPATELQDLYRHWGYTIIGEHDWRPNTNYLSIVMARPIAPLA